MRKNLLSAFVILFISIVCFFVYSDLRTNNDIVNQEQLDIIEENPTKSNLATNEIDQETEEE